MKKQLWILLGILLIASLLRLWQLGVIPPSPDWDEAALGYNAYSILLTGKDEYGASFPLVLQSFDDYKPALYTYLIIPFIPLFGLDILAVRLPSAIMGILAVYLTYLLVRELVVLQQNKHKALNDKTNSQDDLKIEKWKLKIPAISALLLAISPWHIQFSRVAFETNLGLTLNIAFIYLFLRGLRQPFFLIFSAFAAALSLYAYQSEKIFVPLMVVVLAVIYHRQVLQLPKKYVIGALITGLVVVAPILHFTLTNEDALGRARSTSIFFNNQELLEPSVQRLIKAKESNDTLGIILNNRRIVYAQSMVQSYLSHFDPLWLLFTGDIERHHAPGMGLLYHFEFPFLLIGIGWLLFTKQILIRLKEKVLLFSWFLIAPIPASFTIDVPHAVRTLNFLPTFQIFTALGIFVSLLFMARFKKMKFLLLTAILLIIFFNIMYFLNQYFVEQNKAYSQAWQYGYKEAVISATGYENDYQKIVVSNQVPLDQSYIFFLYYQKYPPLLYQQQERINKAYGKYEFRPIEWELDKNAKDTLFIGSVKDFPTDIKPIKIIKYLDGDSAFLFVDSESYEN